MSDELRQEVARALAGVMDAVATPIGRVSIDRLADAVMAKVAPVVEQLRQAEVSRDAYRDERDQTQRELDEARASVERLRGDYRRIRRDRDRVLLEWRSARRRANEVAWLRAEAVRQRDRAQADCDMHMQHRMEIERLLDEELGPEVEDGADAGFVADVALALRRREAERDAARADLAALRASAVVLPEPVQRLVDWHLSSGSANVSPLPLQGEVREALESWLPATVEAAPWVIVEALDEHSGRPCWDVTKHGMPRWRFPTRADAERALADDAAGVSGTGTEASDV